MILQVDLLKSTALPLMKKFGIDGEGFELKVGTEQTGGLLLSGV